MKTERPYFDPEIETMPRDQIEALQFPALKRVIELAYEKAGLVRKKWDEAGVKPSDINSLADFSRLVPFITKDDIRDYRAETGDPFGGILCVPTSELRSISGSSGTTGDPTLLARRDLHGPQADSRFDRCLWDLGIRPGEYAVTINPTIRGSTLTPLLQFGVTPLCFDHTPAEIGRLVETCRVYRPTVLMALSTPLLMGLEQFEIDTGIDLAEVFSSCKAVIWGGEPLGPRGRSLTERWKMNIIEILSLGDATITLEAANHTGAYAWEDEVFVEHIDPDTGLPVPDGTFGELVATPLQNTVDPLIRFRSEDLVWLTREKCPSGRTHARFRVRGRAGDQILVAGKQLLPISIWPTIESQPESKAGLFQIVRPKSPEDFLRLRVGYADNPDLASLEERLKAEIRSQLGIESQLELVPNDELLKLGPPHKIPRIVKLQDPAPMAIPKIGFVGLGQMGARMAARLVDAEINLSVFDLDEAAVERLTSLGATAGNSPLAIADTCEIVLCSLPRPEIVETVLLGAGGILHGSAVKIVVDLSTTGSVVSARVAMALAQNGIVLIDAPVSGGVSAAEAGTLTLMIAGPAEARAAIEPVLRLLGSNLFVIGDEPGLGQKMKLVNNMLCAANAVATFEALVIGVKGGLDAETMLDVINVSSGRSFISTDKVPQCVMPRTFPPRFATELLLKDTKLGVSEALANDAPLWMMNATLDFLGQAIGECDPAADYATLIQYFERRAGVEVSAHQGETANV